MEGCGRERRGVKGCGRERRRGESGRRKREESVCLISYEKVFVWHVIHEKFCFAFFNGWYTGKVAHILIIIDIVIAIDTFVDVDGDMIVVHVKL